MGSKRLILNVGSGRKKIPGVINVDIPTDMADPHFRGKQSTPEVFCDAHMLPFRDKVFDAVLIIHCLEHLFSPLAALIDVHRVTRFRGVLLVEIPDSRRVWRHERREHLYSWSSASLRNIVVRAGFSSVATPPPIKLGPVDRINVRRVFRRLNN